MAAPTPRDGEGCIIVECEFDGAWPDVPPFGAVAFGELD
jgi:hypothetical protein